MLELLIDNWATIAAVIIIALCVFLAVRKMVKDKKKGIGPCGQRCSECPKMQNGKSSEKE